mmetsp:Transcript_2523/g.4817  ORF Transcript_2523/g.4817 Transcript_2523/m.4817 type:complete len:211 (-) Transcript_2523:480-1112(-)
MRREEGSASVPPLSATRRTPESISRCHSVSWEMNSGLFSRKKASFPAAHLSPFQPGCTRYTTLFSSGRKFVTVVANVNQCFTLSTTLAPTTSYPPAASWPDPSTTHESFSMSFSNHPSQVDFCQFSTRNTDRSSHRASGHRAFTYISPSTNSCHGLSDRSCSDKFVTQCPVVGSPADASPPWTYVQTASSSSSSYPTKVAGSDGSAEAIS